MGLEKVQGKQQLASCRYGNELDQEASSGSSNSPPVVIVKAGLVGWLKIVSGSSYSHPAEPTHLVRGPETVSETQ